MKALKEFLVEGKADLQEIAKITCTVSTQIDYNVKKIDEFDATILFDVNLLLMSGKPNNYGHEYSLVWEDINHTYGIKVDLKYHEINEGKINVFLVDDAKVTLDKNNNFKKDLDFIYKIFHGPKEIDLAWCIDYRIQHLIMHKISQSDSRLPIWINDETSKKIAKQIKDLFEA